MGLSFVWGRLRIQVTFYQELKVKQTIEYILTIFLGELLFGFDNHSHMNQRPGIRAIFLAAGAAAPASPGSSVRQARHSF